MQMQTPEYGNSSTLYNITLYRSIQSVGIFDWLFIHELWLHRTLKAHHNPNIMHDMEVN
jgi:hypothetical protein